MSSIARIKFDPRNTKVNRIFFRRVFALAKPYWLRKGALGSWLALAFIVALVPMYSFIGAYSAKILGQQTNELVAKHAEAFWRLLAVFAVITLARSLFFGVQTYVQGRLNLHWRRWLTAYLVDRYLAKRTYFEITVDQSIDNPDQRIQEELAPFCQTMSMLPQLLLGSFVDMAVQAGVLWVISPPMFWCVVIFAAVKTLVLLWAYRPTIRQNYEITVAEADLRYGLLHVRDNAETVAFYRGEHAEKKHILERLETAVKKQLAFISYSARLVIITSGFMNAWAVLPFLFLAPLYFGGKIEYGTITQGTYAATLILSALSIFMNFVPSLTAVAPRVTRLAEIQEKFEHLGQPVASTTEKPQITLVPRAHVSLEHVSIETPGGEIQLVRDLSLTVGAREHLVIIGRTGVGKSSLLRAIAGLWTRGRGTIGVPPPEDVLFLPQRPYMILSNLRDQLLYPRRRTDLSDAQLQEILVQVSLPYLVEKHGGFDAEKDWGRVLSLGEQQRIGFARVLAAQPRFVFLDEATGALDIETEQQLYSLLARSRATFISVGHRPSILHFHKHALRLHAGGTWEILLASEVAVPDHEPDSSTAFTA